MKKVGILAVILMLVVGFTTGCGQKKEKNYLEEITLSDYFALKDSKGDALIYIDSNDDVSATFKKSLNKILNELDVKVKYLDTTKFKDEEETMKFMNADEYTKKSYEVPLLVYIENGTIKNHTTGYTKDSKIRSFVKDNS